MKEYSLFVGVAIGLVLLLEFAGLRTGLFRDRRYWIALAIVVFFQLLMNAALTCPPVVAYDPARILGPRIACAPVEDLGFGWAMVTATLLLWRRLGRGDNLRDGDARDGIHDDTTGQEEP